MTFSIHTPLTYALIAGVIYIKKNGLNNNIYYTIVLTPWLSNLVFLLLEKGVAFDNISKEEAQSFFRSSFVSMFSGIIIYIIFRFIKERV